MEVRESRSGEQRAGVLRRSVSNYFKLSPVGALGGN
ncbi:hypothetical protein EYZ11_013516 [Aspergillus tanneri]|uniref:Uncharacterized protein n=1 Tax=Aspergillus tanneri TaxID=1220188 RepID=A0A4S3IZP1_9EURO|nr:hypothetical protein EYZ11_013516 [Aspergillus tanneri]